MTQLALASPQLWQQAHQGHFIGVDGMRLNYATLTQANARGAVVIASGRSEGYLKYHGLAKALLEQELDVYIWDHRGQGLSERLTRNPDMGHVERFDDYVADMTTFIDTKVLPRKPKKLYLVGHSMGGAIGSLYLQHYPDTFDAAVFSAPMYGIQLPGPRWALEPVLAMMARWNRLFGEPGYIPGGTDYEPKPFERNLLTQDADAYQDFLDLYQQIPELQLGDPTNHWMLESFNAMDRIRSQAQRITTPTLVMQAGNDAIVDNQVMESVVNASTNTSLLRLPNARHELLIETPTIRRRVLSALTDWLQRF
ncbi:alpha/beta fold hydrolase [Ferrimonas sediminum]|nr:alpha/beta fold hydrolase [Ferrimonas sediminum]